MKVGGLLLSASTCHIFACELLLIFKYKVIITIIPFNSNANSKETRVRKALRGARKK